MLYPTSQRSFSFLTLCLIIVWERSFVSDFNMCLLGFLLQFLLISLGGEGRILGDPDGVSKCRVRGASWAGHKRRRRVRGSGSSWSVFATRTHCSARWWCIGFNVVDPSSDRIMFGLPFLGKRPWFIIVANNTRIERKCGRIESEHGNDEQWWEQAYLVPGGAEGMSVVVDECFLPILVNWSKATSPSVRPLPSVKICVGYEENIVT